MNFNTEKIDKHLLILMFLVSGAYGYSEALSFGGQTDVWPQMVSAFIFGGAVLLLFQDYLPEPVRKLVVNSSEMFDVDREFDDGSEEERESDMETSPGSTKQDVKRPLNDTMFTALAITGYVVVGYLVGLLWAAPVFVAAYTLWFRMPRLLVVFLSAVSFAVSYAFMTLMYLSLDEGLLFGGI